MKSTRPQHLDIGVTQPESKRFHANDPVKYLINNAFNQPDEDKFEKLHRELLKSQHISISLLESIIFRSSNYFQHNPKAINYEALQKIISFAVENIINLLSSDNHAEILIYDINSIRYLFYNLGVLAKTGVSFPPLPDHVIQRLLNDFLNIRIENYQNIGNTLIYGLGLLAKYKKINGMIDSSQLQSLLMLVNEHSKSNHSALSHSLYGMGTLAETRHIQGHIKIATPEAILSQLFTCINISNGMYGVALLMENNIIDDMISATCINQTMYRFNLQSQRTGQDVAHIVYSLGIYALNNKIQGAINHYYLLDLIQSIPVSQQQLIHLTQILLGIHRIAKYNNKDLIKHIPVKLVHQLIESIINKQGYLHPVKAATLISQISVFSVYFKELNVIFNRLCDALTVPLHRLSKTQQVKIQSTLMELKLTCPSWYATLSSCLYRQPKKEVSNSMDVEMDVERTSQPHQTTLPSSILRIKINKSKPVNTGKIKILLKQTAPSQPLPATNTVSIKPTRISSLKQNQIRDLINNKDIKGLSILLNAKESHPVTVTRPHQHHDEQQLRKRFKIHAATAHQDAFSKETLVIQFFKDTDTSMLNDLAKKSSHACFDILMSACSPHMRYRLFITQKMHPVLLNLPIKELSSFIEKLISPITIYRDHHAVLRIYDALAIRAEMQPAHKDMINTMATNLINRAMEFHDSCEHPHVIERLQGLSNLDNWMLQEDANASSTVNAPEEVTLPSSLHQPTSIQTQSVSKPITDLPAQTPAPVNSVKQIVNVDYQYDTEDVEAILRARINQGLTNGTLRGPINILASVQLHHLVPGNKVEDVLTDFLLSDQQNHDGCALLPIHINAGHWVGLKLEIHDNKICNMMYYNSSLNLDDDKNRCKIFFDALNNAGLLHENANLHAINIVMNCMQQDDATSCGAYMIENFYCALKNMHWDNAADLTTQIRNRHLHVLHNDNAGYYQNFFAKQQANMHTVPSLMTQLISHQVLPTTVAAQGFGIFNQKPPSEQASAPNLTTSFRR